MGYARGKSGADVIAFHFCSDISDIRDAVYQPTRYRGARVYTVGDHYYCCPPTGQKPPRHRDDPDAWEWEELAKYDDRIVYRAEAK